MDKVIKIAKIIAYVISIILPLLDGAKGVKSKITDIYRLWKPLNFADLDQIGRAHV